MTEDPLNLEFIRLLSKSHWSQAEAARQLKLTPATISRYVAGETRPSTTVLDLFRIKIGDSLHISGALGSEIKQTILSQSELELLEEIRSLDQTSKEQLIQHFKSIAGLIPKSSETTDLGQKTAKPNTKQPHKHQKHINSSLDESELAVLKRAVEVGEAEIESEQKQGAAETSGQKGETSSGASKAASRRPSAPARAPSEPEHEV